MSDATLKPLSIVSWETWEYPKHSRSRWWYLSAGGLGLLLLLFAVTSGSYMFAVIILMIGLIFFLSHLHEPIRLTVQVTGEGVKIGGHFYPFSEIKNFSIIYKPPAVKLLYLDFVNAFRPLISISLEDVDPNAVRTALLPFVFEDLDRTDETMSDLIARLYKL